MSSGWKNGKTWISSAHQGFVTGNMHSNTLAAYRLAAQKGADMIETDVRTTIDGVFIVNHDAEVRGFNEQGEPVTYVISDTKYEDIARVHLTEELTEDDHVPTLEQTLDLVYFAGMCLNIDLKEGLLHAEDVAHEVVSHGMRGRVVYATNGAGAEAINRILKIDPQARFIDTPWNYTRELLSSVKDHADKCYAYTGDFSDENIRRIRESGCMLATISLNAENAEAAFRHHPDMAEYPHTSDFEAIEKKLTESKKLL